MTSLPPRELQDLAGVVGEAVDALRLALLPEIVPEIVPLEQLEEGTYDSTSI